MPTLCHTESQIPMQLTAILDYVRPGVYKVTDLNTNDGEEYEITTSASPEAVAENMVVFCADALVINPSDIEQVTAQYNAENKVRQLFVYTNPKEGQPCSSSLEPPTSLSSSVDTMEPLPSK